MLLTCRYCKGWFENDKKVSFCSPACRNHARAGQRKPKQRICQRCGEAYFGTRYKFCSHDCAFPPALEKPERVLPNCEACGESFKPTNGPKQRFCSIQCCNAQRRKYPASMACSRCGETWFPQWKQQKAGETVCWPCRKPPERDTAPYVCVKQKLKSRLVKRENGRCQDCGLDAEASGRPLEAHHIVPQALGGDNSLGNLKLLCHECHRGSGWERNHSLLLMSGVVQPAK